MSYVNSNYVVLYQKNWSEALRTAKRLHSSLQRLSNNFPISSAELAGVGEDLQDKIDAFRIRFTDLHDCIGQKLFRNLLKLEDETPISMVDVLN